MITNRSIGYTGRLANQIFQHAVLVAVGVKKGYVVKLPAKNETVKPDGCFNFASQKWVPYKLDLYDCFDLKSERASEEETNSLKNKFNEKGFAFDPRVFDVEDSTSIEGYFQSSKYFDDVREDILKEFKFKPEIEKQADTIVGAISNREIVAVHIRRGDNVVNPTFPLIGLDYVGKAMEHFTDKDYNFLIVSDDVPWCREAFQTEDNVFFSEGNSAFVDLCLMSKCQHNIISNSSFSWWSAWANTNKDKRVVAPSNWFKSKEMNDNTKDLYCEGWIVI